MKKISTLSFSILMVVLVLLDTYLIEAKPKAKSKYYLSNLVNKSVPGHAGPGPWDWQNAPSNYPVFSPYTVGKLDQPEFLKINKNVSVMVGETAFLPCRVKNLEKYTVRNKIMILLHSDE